MIEAHATAKYIRSSAQKAKLVLDQIRGTSVNAAFATLQFSRKSVAHDVEKVLRSAVANAQQQDGFGGDIDRLIVSACYANQGPSLKRVRPAPMGRAFRVLKRSTHLTVKVTELPRSETGPKRPGTKRKAVAKRKTAAKRKVAATRKTRGARKTASAGTAGARTSGSKSGAARKTPSSKKS